MLGISHAPIMEENVNGTQCRRIRICGRNESLVCCICKEIPRGWDRMTGVRWIEGRAGRGFAWRRPKAIAAGETEVKPSPE